VNHSRRCWLSLAVGASGVHQVQEWDVDSQRDALDIQGEVIECVKYVVTVAKSTSKGH
jgi:hypothetical protein